MHSISATDVEAVNRVLGHLRHHPDELHRDEFDELRAYLKSLGATLPPPPPPPEKTEENEPADLASEPDEERWELEDVPDDGIPAAVAADATPEDEENAAALKAEAAERAGEGKIDAAVELMTQALRMVPGKAMYWSQRASYLLDCARPGAAFHDANRALSINPQNVRALRVRGTVNRHLGNWEDALKDLSEAQTIDYDEKTDALLRLAQEKSNARRQKRRQREEEEQRQRQEALRRQREQELREEEEERQREEKQHGGFPGGFPSGGMPTGGFPGGGMPAGGFPSGGMPAGGFPSGGMPAGGFPGGAVPPGMEELFRDPELMAAMQDPEVASKFATLMQNPMAAMQMMGDPKVGPLLQKFMSKAMGGGVPGGFSRAPPPPPTTSAGAAPQRTTHPSDELD
ncbi:Hsc70-interacting protein [Trypanosoma grayi]|uniref:Hsc70-interacting protein n=1 Tax=Trypanosoma grayi TaxID=71804 RepID=UPI0004F49369|nr:Hsc70-interacting protein [Trypanosoma grayi]KEG09942.1 Hsc70-interacting protein [Trypanosoma grayi]